MLARLYKEFFRALSNPTRFAIVQLLRARPHYVGELVERLGYDQSRVSHNLGCLLNCGFVEWQWKGKNKVYRLHSDLPPILDAIDHHIKQYGPALDSCTVLDGEARVGAEDLPDRRGAPRSRKKRSGRPAGARS